MKNFIKNHNQHKKKKEVKKRQGRKGGTCLGSFFSSVFNGDIQTSTFSKTPLIEVFKKFIICATSNLVCSHCKFSRKCFHHVLGASTQGCAFLMSSENLKTPRLLGGSKRMSAKHLGLHNTSSPSFIGKKVFF